MGLFEMVFGLFSFIYYRFISFNLIRFWLYFILFLTSPFFAPFPYQKLKRHAYLTVTVFCDPISIPGYVYGGFVAFLQNGGNKYPAVSFLWRYRFFSRMRSFGRSDSGSCRLFFYPDFFLLIKSEALFQSNLLNALSFFPVGTLLDNTLSFVRMKEMDEHLYRKKRSREDG